jgi:hypothetical protein|tara:strand:+ start:108 stop:605 length:498 start_codon:yes stop_codon:yes gene_type:complete
MAREIYCKDVKFSEYSLWHRRQHSGLAMCDLDAIEMCIACNCPLVLLETVKLKNQELHKGHSMTRQLAIKSKLPAFIVWYKIIGGEMPLYVLVKKIAPDYKGGYSSAPERYTFDQWLNYLEFKQVQHFKDCPKQKLFFEKISKDKELRSNRIYEDILLLDIRLLL